MTKILVTGSTGQIGSELTLSLRKKHGNENVVALGHKTPPNDELKNSGPYEMASVIDKAALKSIIEKYEITQIYHLASVLSAKAEEKPDLAWEVNVNGLKNILDLGVGLTMEKIFWPSSIAVFGETTPKDNTPQLTVTEPTFIYGTSKVTGEALCHYYFEKYNLDVRSLRYPGLISYKTLPGGGTTDYAVAIYYGALKEKKYTCFVREDTVLPMMYMDDAIKSALDVMDADSSKIKVRTSYNIAAMSFSAKELAEEIKKHIPEFVCSYVPDERQKIADTWPRVIDDSIAKEEWGWNPEFDLPKMTEVMLNKLEKKFKN